MTLWEFSSILLTGLSKSFFKNSQNEIEKILQKFTKWPVSSKAQCEKGHTFWKF